MDFLSQFNDHVNIEKNKESYRQIIPHAFNRFSPVSFGDVK